MINEFDDYMLGLEFGSLFFVAVLLYKLFNSFKHIDRKPISMKFHEELKNSY
jgi:hypothetical protein